MFQHTSKINIAESLFTGLYIVVSKSEETSEELFCQILDYLNKNFSSININKFLTSFIKDECINSVKPRAYFKTKLRLGPTQILWNVEKESSLPREEILNISKSLGILKKDEVGNQFCQNSKIGIKYISEEKFSSFYIPNLFYSSKVLANIVVHYQENTNYSNLIDLFYSKKAYFEEKFKTNFQFLLTKSDTNVRNELIDGFDRYVVKENLHKYRKINQITDEEFTYDSIFFSDYEVIFQTLNEIVVNLLSTFLSITSTILSNPDYTLENVRKPISHQHSGSKIKSNSLKSGMVKVLGDLYLLMNQDLMAIAYYLASNYYFISENNHLEHSKSLFAVTVSMCRHFGFHSYLGRNKDLKLDNDESRESKVYDDLNTVSDLSRGEMKRNNRYDKQLKTAIELVPKEMIEKPLEYLMHYLKRCFILWLKAFDNSDEFQLLFVFYTNILMKVDRKRLTQVISSFIVFSKKMLRLKEQRNILEYTVEIVSKTKYERKLNFYKYLQYEMEINDHSTKPESTSTNSDDPVICLKDDDPLHKVMSFLSYNMGEEGLDEFNTKCKYYSGWHKILQVLVDNEILRQSLSNLDNVQKLYLVTLLNCLNEQKDARESVDPELFHKQISKIKNFDISKFPISHLVLSMYSEDLEHKLNSNISKDLCNSINSLGIRVKSFKQDNHPVYFTGGFENLHFDHFPIVYHMKLSGNDIRYKYSRSNMKKIDYYYSDKCSNSQNCFSLRKRFLHKSFCKCNYSKIYRVDRMLRSISIEANCGFEGEDVPKCVVFTEKYSGNVKCKVKTSEHSMKRVQVVLEESMESKRTSKFTQYVYDYMNDEPVVYTNNSLTIKVRFYNPLPINLELRNVQLLGFGVEFESIPCNFTLPPFTRNHVQSINLVVKECGILYITSIKFLLFNTFTSYQLVLNSNDSNIFNFINSLVNILPTRTISGLDEEDLNGKIGQCSFIKLKGVNDYNRAVLTIYFTDFNENTEINRTSTIKTDSIGSNFNTNRSNLSSYPSILSEVSVVRMKSVYEDWNGFKVPNFGLGTVSKELTICNDQFCMWCCLFENLKHQFSPTESDQKLITGEKRLIYVKLTNENEKHALVNISLSILPVTYKRDKKTMEPEKTAEDYVYEQILKGKLNHLKQEIYSRYIIILNQHALLTRKECREVDKVVLMPGEEIYVPVIYRANSIISNFDVIFDYNIVPVQQLRNCDSSDLLKGSVYRSVKVEVDDGFKITNLQAEPIIEFNHKLFIYNMNEFRDILTESTVDRILTYKNTFNNKFVKFFLKIRNGTQDTFYCRIKDSQFVSSPGTSTRYPVKLKRVENKRGERRRLVNVILDKITLFWKCFPDRMGSVKLYDLHRPKLNTEDLQNLCSDRGILGKRNNERCIGYYSKSFVWKMSKLNKVPKWYLSRIHELVRENLDNLTLPKISVKISVSLNQNKLGNIHEVLDVEVGTRFYVNVLARNSGEDVIRHYRVVIIPYDRDLYTKVEGLEWFGSLECMGFEPIDPVYRTRSITIGCESEESGFESFGNVASVEFVANQACKLAVNAAIVVDGINTIFWNSDPAIIFEGIVVPGTILGTTNDYTPLDNVYVKDSIIYSAILGTVFRKREQEDKKPGISVVSNHARIPYVGCTVIGQITKVHINKADCNIICVDGRVMKDIYKGTLTSNNVLESKNIEVLMHEWFKPGDFIKCKVIYAGEGKQFTLSTAGLDLGVVKAKSKNGEDMVPISWKYFMSTESQTLEKRFWWNLKNRRSFSIYNSELHSKLKSGKLTYYDVLQVPRNADKREIKKAYLKLVKEYHPDTSKAIDARSIFVCIKESHDVLSDRAKRILYDQKLNQNNINTMNVNRVLREVDMERWERYKRYTSGERNDSEEDPNIWIKTVCRKFHNFQIGAIGISSITISRNEVYLLHKLCSIVDDVYEREDVRQERMVKAYFNPITEKWERIIEPFEAPLPDLLIRHYKQNLRPVDKFNNVNTDDVVNKVKVKRFTTFEVIKANLLSLDALEFDQ